MLREPLKNVMTQGYLYVNPEQAAGKALGVMRDMRISSVFVLDGDKPVGIVTERKIVEKAISGVNLFFTTVATIMSSPLIALTADKTVGDACNLMKEREIRHIGVVDQGFRLVGTLTPGNIVNLLGMESFSSTATVKDVMHAEVVTVQESTSLKEAMQAIFTRKTCCAVVMKEGYPAGVVSEKDATRCLGFGNNIHTTPVHKVMGKPVIGIDQKDSVAQAIITMRRHRIHRLVVYGNNGVCGILSLNNLVRNIETILK